MTHLVLFDIDGTLLKSGGLGLTAMQAAARELLHPDFTMAGIDVAGRIDPLIVREMFQKAGVELTPELAIEFRKRFVAIFRDTMRTSSTCRALPGGRELVHAVRQHADCASGLLTGNYQETGTLKLSLAGYDPSGFVICAWGDDSPHEPPARDHLTPVAIARHLQHFGTPVAPDRVTIIGDTPHDVRCAHAHGCACIAVATGQYSRDQLHAAGADLVVDDLLDTHTLLNWTLGSR
ncbi:MAG: HAD family hydrolase [Phycisphaerales bacterium]|nr:HAD family hydrolase [Phycisphaerales bacterium]